MNELAKRLTNESPRFFKRIVAIGITLGVIGGALMAAPEAGITLPPLVDKLAGYFTLAGLVAAAIAKTTVADSSVLEKKDEAK